MGCDPSPMVRRAIVRCIGATKVTLPIVLRRTLDVDENVRKAAYKFIADKVHIRSLTISRREEIIRRGLTDRNEGVRNVVAKDLGIIRSSTILAKCIHIIVLPTRSINLFQYLLARQNILFDEIQENLVSNK